MAKFPSRLSQLRIVPRGWRARVARDSRHVWRRSSARQRYSSDADLCVLTLSLPRLRSRLRRTTDRVSSHHIGRNNVIQVYDRPFRFTRIRGSAEQDRDEFSARHIDTCLRIRASRHSIPDRLRCAIARRSASVRRWQGQDCGHRRRCPDRGGRNRTASV